MAWRCLLGLSVVPLLACVPILCRAAEAPSLSDNADPAVTATTTGGEREPHPLAGRLSSFRLNLPRPSLAWLDIARLRRWRMDAQFGTEWQRQQVSSPGQPRQRSRNLHFVEQVHVANSGFVLDPRLLSFSLGVTAGFTQDEASVPGQTTRNRARRLAYEGNAVVLPLKPYSLRLSASRFEDVENTDLAGSLDILSETYGVGMTLQDFPLRSDVNFSSNRTTQAVRLSPGARRNEVRRKVSYRGTRLGEVSDLSVNYDFDDVDDRILSTIDFRSHRVGLRYHRFFGPYLEKDFVSRLDVLRREGASDETTVTTNETLSIEHLPTLRTTYSHALSFTDIDRTQTTANHATISLQHRLYRSLWNRLRAMGRYVELTGGRNFAYGGSYSPNYKKRIFGGARFSASGNTSYEIEDQNFSSSERSAFSESHTVVDLVPILLDNRRVQRETIVVTDVAGTVIYQEGFDYDVTQTGDATTIDRLPLGRLEDGQEIFVAYRFTSARKLRFSRFGNGAHVGLDYSWLSLFYDWQRSGSNLLSGEGEEFLDDVTEQNAGVETRWRGSHVSASGRGEYQTYDSNNVAFDTVRFAQSLTWRPAKAIGLSGHLKQSFARFRNPSGREDTNLHGRLSGSWRPLPRLSVHFFGSAFWRTGKPVADQLVLDSGVRLSWSIRWLRIEPNFSASRARTGDSTSTNFRAALWLTRRIL